MSETRAVLSRVICSINLVLLVLGLNLVGPLRLQSKVRRALKLAISCSNSR